MNANELADVLDKTGWYKRFTEWDLLDEAATMLLKQQAEIEALKAEIIAIEKNVDYWADKSTKTLTDEEIDEIVMKQFGESRYDFFLGTWRDFARAILRKAQGDV